MSEQAMTETEVRPEPDLSVQLGKVELANPVMTASGTCGYAFELIDFVRLSSLGAFITKSITLEPRAGNRPQRTCETAAGMLNSIGLANVGLERFCEEKAPLLGRLGVPVFVNVAGKTMEEYVTVSRRLGALEAVSGLEINVSCPNVREGGLSFGTDPAVVSRLVGSVRQVCPETVLIVKLTPNVTDVCAVARAAIEAGADVLSMINTLTGMAIDAERRCCVLGNRTGGLSGPAVKPVALYLVDKVYREVAKPAGVPIIGLGGIAHGHDAVEFLLAGATAVSVGTSVLSDPGCLERLVGDIRNYLCRHKIGSVRELVGRLEG